MMKAEMLTTVKYTNFIQGRFHSLNCRLDRHYWSRYEVIMVIMEPIPVSEMGKI